jgi:hypothetical protein
MDVVTIFGALAGGIAIGVGIGIWIGQRDAVYGIAKRYPDAHEALERMGHEHPLRPWKLRTRTWVWIALATFFLALSMLAGLLYEAPAV